MKKNYIKTFRICIMVASFLIFATTASAGNIINVPEDYATIQAAITAANPGDTIIVAAGTYNERLLISKSIDLRGAQYGVDPTPSGARTTPAVESIVDLTGVPLVNPNVHVEITASSVSVAGFTLIGSPIFHWSDEAVVRCSGDDVTLEDNIIDGYQCVLYKGGTGLTVHRNRVVANKNGVVVQPGLASDVTISGNVFTLGSNPGGDESAIYMGSCSHSSVTGNTATGFVNAKGLIGSSVDHLTISGNTFVGNKDAISIWGTSMFITISNNVLSFSGRFGINIKGQDVLITGNEIADNGAVGVNIEYHQIATERITISGNSISGNTNYGVKTTAATETINAEYNWWGDTSGPSGEGEGGGDVVSANVDFEPWMNMYYGDVPLSGGFQSGHFTDIWDLTEGDLVMSFTFDGNGLVDDSGAHAWSELGLRTVCYGDFNPTWMEEGAGIWLATDYDWTANTFDPDPPGSPKQDLDDKLILQKGGGMDEFYYNLPLTPPSPWDNHAVWFDRDGVDQWQAQMWGAINGVTYNTGGTYNVVITLHATDDTTGEAYMTINGEPQGFYDPNWHSGPADLMPAGMTFTGNMTQMQVFYGLYGYGATHGVEFKNIMVAGVVLVDDQGPITSNVVATPNPVSVDTDVTLTATVGDCTTGGSTIASAEYSLDGVPWEPMDAGDGDFDEVSEDVTASLSALTAGVHNVCVRGTDTANNDGDEVCILLVVYDPTAGFVTGGGWIMSPEGAYRADPLLTGKANFGFIARYKKGAKVPIGNTEFQFNAGDLNFHSSSYDWLVVTGSNYAKFKGTGTINGSGEYKFMLWAGDGELDTFRIKIWTEDEFGVETVEYDNVEDQAIGGGSIVIHTKKK